MLKRLLIFCLLALSANAQYPLTCNRPGYCGNALPGTCTVGDTFYLTGTTNATGAYTCTTTNVWTQQGPSGGSSYRTLVVLGGDVTDSSGINTYTDCTGLSFAVTSGIRYHFYAQIWYTAAATTTGSGWSINGPSTTNLAYKSTYTLTATTVTTNFATAYGIPVASNASSLTAGNIVILEGTILPSANGTVIVRFMTEVDTSAIVCKAGSTLEWW